MFKKLVITKTITIGTLVLTTVSLTSCNATSYKPIPHPAEEITKIEQSELLVLPKTIPKDYFLESIVVNEGVGALPLSGKDARRAKRLQAAIAKNASNNERGEVMSWCAAKVEDFEEQCKDLAGVHQYRTVFNGIEVIFFSDTASLLPKTNDSITSNLQESPWAYTK